jgi:hypothetical protein
MRDNARIADAVLNESDQLFLADRIEERRHVGVENEVHSLFSIPTASASGASCWPRFGRNS